MRAGMFGKALAALAPLLLSPDPSFAQGHSGSGWNEAFAGVSIVAPNPSKGGSLAFERHVTSGASLFVDGSAYPGGLLLMGGVRIRPGERRLVSPFAHLQAGALLTGYGLPPLASCGVGLDTGGTATVPRVRVQVDGLFTTEGAGVRLSIGLLWPFER